MVHYTQKHTHTHTHRHIHKSIVDMCVGNLCFETLLLLLFENFSWIIMDAWLFTFFCVLYCIVKAIFNEWKGRFCLGRVCFCIHVTCVEFYFKLLLIRTNFKRNCNLFWKVFWILKIFSHWTGLIIFWVSLPHIFPGMFLWENFFKGNIFNTDKFFTEKK